jgi:hypothetical protein
MAGVGCGPAYDCRAECADWPGVSLRVNAGLVTEKYGTRLEQSHRAATVGDMRASLERLLGRPGDFPLEITLSSGDRYLLPHPDHAHVHPKTRDLIIYPDDGPFSLVVNPDQVVSVKTVRKAS